MVCTDGDADDCTDPCTFSPAGVACRVSLPSLAAGWWCDAAAPGVACVGACVLASSRVSSSERERSVVVADTVAVTAANRPVLAIAAWGMPVPINGCETMDAAGGASSAATGVDGNVADAVLIEAVLIEAVLTEAVLIEAVLTEPGRDVSRAEIFSALLFKPFA